MPEPAEQTRINTQVPHSARLWNYWLGGKDNFASDRAAGDEIARQLPSIIDLARLVDAVPSGSYLAIAHGCHDINREAADSIVSYWNEHGTPKILYRSSAEIARFFDGLELLEPGVVPCSRWRPGPGDPDIDVNQYAGVARKP